MQATIHAGRRVALALALLLASAGALAMSEPATGHAGSHDSSHAATTGSARQATLHDGMRELWEQHVAWTRLPIVGFFANTPDLPATQARLLRNQTDIGNAIKPYYGRAAGNQLTGLLREHITGAVAVLQAAKAGDTAALAAAKDAWSANGREIADFLNAANPRNWPRATLRSMMRTHLDQTIEEAVAQLTGDYAASVRMYDQIEDHILDMADTLSSGIVAQFPRRFR
jgi:hypothetical protein